MLNEQLQLRHYDDDGEKGSEYGRKIENAFRERRDVKSVSFDEIDSAKFALFCKWLNESNFEGGVKGAVNNQSTDKESSDDEFVDTNSETVLPISDKQFKESLPSVIEQANISSIVHGITQTKEDHSTTTADDVTTSIEKIDSAPKIESTDEHIYETLEKMPSQTNLLELPNQSLLSLNLSCASSASDLTSESGFPRRPASHNKGRAPPIPLTQPITDKTVEAQSIKTVDCTPQEKEKKKKNLLTYIPSIFKPVTPSNSSKNLTKETEI